MTINGRRTFRSNSGKRYMVENLLRQDKAKYPEYRYYMMVADKPDGIYRCCCDLDLSMLKFKTIKEAQRYVRDSELLIQVCYY